MNHGKTVASPNPSPNDSMLFTDERLPEFLSRKTLIEFPQKVLPLLRKRFRFKLFRRTAEGQMIHRPLCPAALIQSLTRRVTAPRLILGWWAGGEEGFQNCGPPVPLQIELPNLQCQQKRRPGHSRTARTHSSKEALSGKEERAHPEANRGQKRH